MALERNPLLMTQSKELPITIRPAYPNDEPALRRLADLDSSSVPSEPLLVAEVDGELRVAISLTDRRAIADPFAPTAHIIDLMQDHITRLAETSGSRRRRLLLRLVPALGLRTA